jgi:hypothetical protein
MDCLVRPGKLGFDQERARVNVHPVAQITVLTAVVVIAIVILVWTLRGNWWR